jgi:signal transduction histidine kinase
MNSNSYSDKQSARNAALVLQKRLLSSIAAFATTLAVHAQRVKGAYNAAAQQLKLASMGRLSASIAHEIRNPLAAIRHANGLLAEQLEGRHLKRLATIVEDNCLRLNRIIEDVLSISRRGTATPPIFDLQRVEVVRGPQVRERAKGSAAVVDEADRTGALCRHARTVTPRAALTPRACRPAEQGRERRGS